MQENKPETNLFQDFFRPTLNPSKKRPRARPVD
jgi:hypothetical protein